MSKNKKKNERERKKRGRKIVEERRRSLKNRKRKMSLRTPKDGTVILLFTIFLTFYFIALFLFLLSNDVL